MPNSALSDTLRCTRWSAWLRNRMTRCGLSVADLAAACGCNPSCVERWRTGADPGLRYAHALTVALGVPLGELSHAAAGDDFVEL